MKEIWKKKKIFVITIALMVELLEQQQHLQLSQQQQER